MTSRRYGPASPRTPTPPTSTACCPPWPISAAEIQGRRYSLAASDRGKLGGLGVARMGGLGENSSGDFFLALATGNRALGERDAPFAVRMLPNEQMDSLFEAVVDATEEAILNAMLAAETMTGRDGHMVSALDADSLTEALRRS